MIFLLKGEENVLLEVKDLHTYFYVRKGIVKAVEGVSFSISPKETLAIVGESGCGKSVTASSIMRLLPTNDVNVTGSIIFKKINLLNISEEQMRRIRGKDISMIFQDPMNSLNPLMNCGKQVVEAILANKIISRKEAEKRTIELFESTGIPDAKNRLGSYPFQLSGGLRQRVMIAMALSCEPSLLIADEPTTALDVTIQTQILHLINNLKKKINMSIIFISHDLGVVTEIADRVAVMYAGIIVEETTVSNLFSNPSHPYTKGLLDCIPGLNTPRKTRLKVIKGVVPDAYSKGQGCPFNPRCSEAIGRCLKEIPTLKDINNKHLVACWLYAN